MGLQARKMGTGPDLPARSYGRFPRWRHSSAWRAFSLAGFAIDIRFLGFIAMRDLWGGRFLSKRAP
jgi:hypothetical protein